MIQITVMYTDRTTETFRGKTFQQGDKALSIAMEEGGYLAIPTGNVRAYQVNKVEEGTDKAPQPDDGGMQIEGGVEAEGDPEQEEGDTQKEEA